MLKGADTEDRSTSVMLEVFHSQLGKSRAGSELRAGDFPTTTGLATLLIE